jgi:hypothetical protein
MTAAQRFTGWDALAKAHPIGRVNDHHRRGRFSRPTPITTNFPAGSVACGNQPALLQFSDRPGNSATCRRERGTPRSNDPRGIRRAGVQTTPAPLAYPTPLKERFSHPSLAGRAAPGSSAIFTFQKTGLHLRFADLFGRERDA